MGTRHRRALDYAETQSFSLNTLGLADFLQWEPRKRGPVLVYVIGYRILSFLLGSVSRMNGSFQM